MNASVGITRPKSVMLDTLWLRTKHANFDNNVQNM